MQAGRETGRAIFSISAEVSLKQARIENRKQKENEGPDGSVPTVCEFVVVGHVMSCSFFYYVFSDFVFVGPQQIWRDVISCLLVLFWSLRGKEIFRSGEIVVTALGRFKWSYLQNVGLKFGEGEEKKNWKKSDAWKLMNSWGREENRTCLGLLQRISYLCYGGFSNQNKRAQGW